MRREASVACKLHGMIALFWCHHHAPHPRGLVEMDGWCGEKGGNPESVVDRRVCHGQVGLSTPGSLGRRTNYNDYNGSILSFPSLRLTLTILGLSFGSTRYIRHRNRRSEDEKPSYNVQTIARPAVVVYGWAKRPEAKEPLDAWGSHKGSATVVSSSLMSLSTTWNLTLLPCPGTRMVVGGHLGDILILPL